MIIFRYLVKEVLTTLVALTSILLLIFLSNQFVQYLSRAAAGKMPGMVVLKLMMLEIPNLLGLLVPLGLYIAILVAYGRLYAESEMTVLRACGYSPKRLLSSTMILASFVAVIVAALILWVNPVISTARAKLIRSSGVSTLIQTIMPERFKAVTRGKRVFYVQSVSRDHSVAKNIFLAEREDATKEKDASWKILWASNGRTTDKDGLSYLSLQQGHEYLGVPGEADFRVASFSDYRARLPQQSVSVNDDKRTLPTAQLWPLNNPDLGKAAELQWRLSVPLMVLVLAFLAVPLSRVNPRQGKYAKLLPAIIVYIIYANLMFVSRNWIVAKKVPLWIGMWGLHAAVLLFALGLFFHQRMRRS